MKSKIYRIHIYPDNSDQAGFSFSAVVKDGIACYHGQAYLVGFTSDGKQCYGLNHGPEITEEATLAAMQAYMRGE